MLRLLENTLIGSREYWKRNQELNTLSSNQNISLHGGALGLIEKIYLIISLNKRSRRIKEAETERIEKLNQKLGEETVSEKSI